MREQEPAPTPFRISLLGPSGVGKTSLVTAMLAESQKILAGSGTAMRPVGRRTSDAIARNQFKLEEYLLVGEFTADRIIGTREAFIFALGFDPGTPGTGIGIELLDFPGGWLSARRTRVDYGPLWHEVRDFIVGSTSLMSDPPASNTEDTARDRRERRLRVTRRILAGLLVAAWIALTWISFQTSYLQVCTDQVARVGNTALVRSCDPLSLTDAPLLALVGTAVLLLLPDVSSLEIPGILRLERRVEAQVDRQEKIAEEIKNLVQQNQHQRQEASFHVYFSEANRLATGAAEATRLVAGFNEKKGAFDDTDAT